MIIYLKLNITFVVEKREERDMPADTSRSPHYIIYITARDRISLFQKSFFLLSLLCQLSLVVSNQLALNIIRYKLVASKLGCEGSTTTRQGTQRDKREPQEKAGR